MSGRQGFVSRKKWIEARKKFLLVDKKITRLLEIVRHQRLREIRGVGDRALDLFGSDAGNRVERSRAFFCSKLMGALDAALSKTVTA